MQLHNGEIYINYNIQSAMEETMSAPVSIYDLPTPKHGRTEIIQKRYELHRKMREDVTLDYEEIDWLEWADRWIDQE